MTVKLFRRGSARCIGLCVAFFTIMLCLYYMSIGQQTTPQQSLGGPGAGAADGSASSSSSLAGGSAAELLSKGVYAAQRLISGSDNKYSRTNLSLRLNSLDDAVTRRTSLPWQQQCQLLDVTTTDITTMDEFAKFDFQPEWMKSKEYWDNSFETRYATLKKDAARPPLKVIIVPHSHNDPGWLKTFTNYFQSDTRQILNLIIAKMHEYTDMTFIWSEMSFLQLWWDQAHPTKQRALKQLIQQGRFEITTGGWVMTDEANVHLYAMVDQLIEGHQWCKNNLNYTPVTGWSIDPFGHGSTVPYLLSASGFKGTIIQRIHYAWKQWLAKTQNGDFVWSPDWQLTTPPDASFYSAPDSRGGSLLTHNMPFDIYSIKHSCGPHPFICLNFDFRKIPGEYTEYSIKAQFINDENIEQKADLLIEQYSRTASLYPHNVALIPLGDDFRYNKEREVEQQYTNYKRLIDYINQHKERYETEISFGLPRDYFEAINDRQGKFPSLKGDFFVYSDIFSEGRPAYWSGYYTTRPAYKLLSRELESNLRGLEILFTVALNRARQSNNYNALRIFEKNYEKMISARRNLGLFQHHDAITGTSKAQVMRDYGIRLFESLQDAVKLQESTIELLVQSEVTNEHGFVLSELEREGFQKQSRKSAILVAADNASSDFVVYNSLAQERLEVVTIRTRVPNVEIRDGNGKVMEIQINPVWNITDTLDSIGLPIGNGDAAKIRVSEKLFEVLFVTRLPALSLVTFSIRQTDVYKGRMATLYCNDCKEEEKKTAFEVRNQQPGDVQLENHVMRLLFDGQSGFLKTVTKKSMGKAIQCAIKFGAYRSAQFHSGAYLFKVDREQKSPEEDVLEQYSADVKILITSGPVASDVTAIYGPFLAHTVRIFNTKTALDRAIYIENDVDFEPPPKNRETEMFMRIVTDIENGDVPEFHSDLNSFQYQRRVKVPSIGVEGNYFPITSAAFIQDERMRLTLMTTHAQGAASLEPGQLEVMVDRRTLYDDYRGMGEGVVDSRLARHNFWMLLEQFEFPSATSSAKPDYQVPTLFANQLLNALNYPANMYFVEKPEDPTNTLRLNRDVRLLSQPLPCDVHLLNLRTLTETDLPLFPSSSALLVLHRQGYSCRSLSTDAEHDDGCTEGTAHQEHIQIFRDLRVASMTSTLLTGLKQHQPIHKFGNVQLEPMELRTVNISFSAIA